MVNELDKFGISAEKLKEILDRGGHEVLLVNADLSATEHVVVAKLCAMLGVDDIAMLETCNEVERDCIAQLLARAAQSDAESIMRIMRIIAAEQSSPIKIEARTVYHPRTERHYASKWDEQREHLNKRGRKKW